MLLSYRSSENFIISRQEWDSVVLAYKDNVCGSGVQPYVFDAICRRGVVERLEAAHQGFPRWGVSIKVEPTSHLDFPYVLQVQLADLTADKDYFVALLRCWRTFETASEAVMFKMRLHDG